MKPELIILDLYGTLVKADINDESVRPGFQEFWEYYKNNSLIVLSTDAPTDILNDTLSRTKLTEKFDELYDWRHCTAMGEKKLNLILNDYKISSENSVFIGDNYLGREEKAAKNFGIPYIKIPQFRQDKVEWPQIESHQRYTDFENHLPFEKRFNFKSLIGKL